jgi:hypothetical protein
VHGLGGEVVRVEIIRGADHARFVVVVQGLGGVAHAPHQGDRLPVGTG